MKKLVTNYIDLGKISINIANPLNDSGSSVLN